MTISDAYKFIPKRFSIAGNLITVEVQEIGKNFGDFDPFRNKIRIFLSHKDEDDDEIVQFTEEQIRNTFMHELGHVISWFYDNDMTEVFAQSFANIMCEYERSKVYE